MRVMNFFRRYVTQERFKSMLADTVERASRKKKLESEIRTTTLVGGFIFVLFLGSSISINHTSMLLALCAIIFIIQAEISKSELRQILLYEMLLEEQNKQKNNQDSESTQPFHV